MKINMPTLEYIIGLVLEAQDISHHHKMQILQVCHRTERIMHPPGLITTKMVATILDVSERTVHNYVKRGMLHPTLLSKRKISYKIDEIIQLIDKCVDTGRYTMDEFET